MIRAGLARMFVVLAIVVTVNTVVAQSYSPRVGRRHAELVLPLIDTGKPVSLTQLRGKKVLLVHFASW